MANKVFPRSKQILNLLYCAPRYVYCIYVPYVRLCCKLRLDNEKCAPGKMTLSSILCCYAEQRKLCCIMSTISLPNSSFCDCCLLRVFELIFPILVFPSDLMDQDFHTKTKTYVTHICFYLLFICVNMWSKLNPNIIPWRFDTFESQIQISDPERKLRGFSYFVE